MAAMPLVQIWQGRAGQGLGRERTNLSISSRPGEGGSSRLAILQLQPQQQRRDISWADPWQTGGLAQVERLSSAEIDSSMS